MNSSFLSVNRSIIILLLLPLAIHAQDSARHEKKISFTALPTFSYDRSKGAGFGLITMGFFKLGTGEATKLSCLNVSGQYTTEGNWYVNTITQLYFAEDRYRLVAGAGYMNSNFQTYQNMAGEDAIEIPYNNHGVFVFLSPTIRVYDRLYVGIGGQMFHSHLEVDAGSVITQTEWMNSLAATAMYDSRDNTYTPSKGWKGVMRYNIFPEWLKNDSAFNKIHLEINNYVRLDKNKILASRFSSNMSLGNVPFVAQNYVGNKDIRGYTKGEYRGDQIYALQTEFRWNFYKRWGMVGFFGLAMTTNPTSSVLPGGGAGIRFMVLPKYRINAGIDGAAGKDDWGIYFRITEAF